jgi:hypothetical protein
MGKDIDRLALFLASGTSRRAALGALLAGGAALLPWTAAGKDKKKRRRQRRKDIARYVAYCQHWCDEKFTGDEEGIHACIDAAKTGKGPCYSATEKGPGHFCLRVKHCPDHKYCCPTVVGDLPVTEGVCCAKGTVCGFINGTSTGEQCEV